MKTTIKFIKVNGSLRYFIFLLQKEIWSLAFYGIALRLWHFPCAYTQNIETEKEKQIKREKKRSASGVILVLNIFVSRWKIRAVWTFSVDFFTCVINFVFCNNAISVNVLLFKWWSLHFAYCLANLDKINFNLEFY